MANARNAGAMKAEPNVGTYGSTGASGATDRLTRDERGRFSFLPQAGPQIPGPRSQAAHPSGRSAVIRPASPVSLLVFVFGAVCLQYDQTRVQYIQSLLARTEREYARRFPAGTPQPAAVPREVWAVPWQVETPKRPAKWLVLGVAVLVVVVLSFLIARRGW